MAKIQLIATATFGLEAVVAREVSDLGYSDVKVENARVLFEADESAISRCNLWLRSADRVLIRIGEFGAQSFDELFERTKALPWEEWLPVDANFPVTGKSVKSKLFSVSDCQAIVKKAIVERLKKVYHKSWFDETGPQYKIEVALLKDNVTLTIDTTGPGLHKRGYRKLSAQAPLKETLAAAMINLSYWNHERVLIDPFCGSGTIPIEAALIGLNIAPGINRNFVSETWPQIPTAIWQQTRAEANDLIKRDRILKIIGTDIDEAVLSLARYHRKLANLNEQIHLQRLPLAELRSSYKYGCVICNPPYGERIGEVKEIEQLYRQMGRVFQQLDTWSIYVLTAHQNFEKIYGKKADRRRKLYNGRIECQFYQFYGPKPPNKNN
ncbi:MAG TPA: class I SAM-dependent RNA methyltransferase [Bacillota bacterium]|jgi:putative N6-adenine-specific DNA methylase|nr:class I SAM-dependent RNA methyltransferase [Bacillota bacterium]HOL10850.1 class I SAM-dependent RNA methyltransferase [Bacillota bacterium]HPO96420.1 class I SAM-dependent RNA methyltransferase [Bacillota bacterium]